MNRKRIGALGKVALVFLLTLTCFNAFISAQDENAAVEFDIESTVTLNEDKTSATISLDAQSINEQYTLSEIIDPNGTTMDFSNLNYEVTEDGTYNFTVTYTYLENEEIKEETYEKQVKVEGIDKSDAEETPVETQQTPGLRSTITNGNVSIDIPDYDELVGWNNGDVKDMQVTVDFGDSTTANKKIKITLPEGLRFESITVKNGTSTTGADASILSVYGDSDPRATAISSMTIPKKETVASKGATYGSVEYEMINTTEKVVLEFKVSVDMSRYYGPHTILNEITAEATKGTTNELVGGSVVTQSVDAIGSTVGSGNITYYSTTSAAGTATVLSSTGTSTEQGRVHRIDTGLLSWTTKVTNRYAKSKTYELYYPKGMEFSHIQVSEGFPGSYEIVDIDDVNGKVTMKVDGWTTRQQFWVWYTVPVGTTAGTYTVDGKDTVTYTWYDDTTSTYTRTSANYSVEVIDPSATKDKMTITQSRDIYSDTTVENAFQYGPQFIIANKQPKVTENQIAEFEIDSNWQVSRVHLPFDKSIAGNEITNIQYKTNKNDWRTYTPSSALSMNGAVAVLTKSDVGLDDDEYFIGVKANVGSFSTEYVSVSLISNTATVNTYGIFKSGVSATSADVTFRMYEEGNETDTTEQITRKIIKATGSNRTILSASTLTFYDMDDNVITSVTAGNQFQTKGTILINSNTAHGMHILENPEIYIREIDGVTINTSSISLKNSDGSDVTFSVSEHTNTYGEKIYKLTTQDSWIGQYKGENQESNRYTISFTSATNVNATGNFDARDFLAFGNKSTGMVATDDTSVPTFTDIYDFDGDGDYTNKLLSVKTKSFGINENKNVLVETFLALENEDPKDPYVEGDVNTLAYFTPGTNADYIAKITNNGDVPADAMDIYIPIPKEGQNFGTTFQSEDFKWDMKLTGAITVPAGFKVYYATNASETNYKTTANYTEYPSDYSDVNMVKIVATAEIPVGAEREFRVPLNVDETFATATSGNKIGTRNIFNPSYRVESDKFIGDLTGTKAGTELVIAEIGGTVFIDNNGDGLYKAEDGDTAVSGHEVRLWKLVEVPSGTDYYEEVMDSSGTSQVSVTTNANGVYLFDYTTGMGYGTYAVEFVEKTGSTYQYTVNNNSVGNEGINSDAIVANGIPKPEDNYRGWVLDIDATKPVAKTIGCGFLEYDPPVDLTLTVPSDTQIVKVGETITVTPTAITPDFWESIKHTTQAYTWELVNASDATYVSLANKTSKTVSVTGVAKTTGTQTVDVKLTIKDIYGQTKSKVVKVKVNTSTPPTLTTPVIDTYIGSVVDWLGSEVTAIDDNGDTITLVSSGAGKNVEWNNSSVPMIPGTGALTTAGTYNVEYKVTDAYGNTTTQNRIVKVNGLPTISSSVQTYTLGDTTIATQVAGKAIASYPKASDTVSDAPTDTAITTGITYAIKSGPSTTGFTKAGKYVVEYTVVHAGITAKCEADVLVNDETSKIVNDLTIRGDNIVLTQDEAKTFTKTDAISKTGIKAYEYIRTDGVITSVDDISGTITSTDVTDIKNVTAKGGEFRLTFTATGTSGTITKEILVVVEGTEIQENDGIVVKAKGFTIANTDAIGLTDAIAQSSGNGNVSAYLLKDETPIATIEASTTELAAINAVGLAGATEDLTFTAKDNGKTSTITVSVVVSPTLVGPTITANDCEHYVGDAFDVLHDVTAEDATTTPVTLKTTGTDKNTVVTHSIPNGSDKFTTAGTYEVSIKVTDQFGNDSTETRKVKVNGLPTITVPVKTYYLGDTTIATQVAEAASASYLKADDTVGTAPTATAVTGITNTIKSGPSTDYSEVGTYVVEYTVTNTDGKTATKEVNVLILDDTTKTENDLAIRADNIVLTQDEAKALTKADAITRTDVKAYEYIRTDGIITSVDDISGTLTSADVSDIKNVSTKGGEFRLTFTATGSKETITKEILVVVEGTEIQENDGIVVKAKEFTIANTDAATLDDTTAQGNGSVSAYLLKDETPIVDIEADTTDLTDINAVGLEGDTKPLTFTAEDNGKTSTITVDVTISATLIKPTITADDCEHYVGDSFDMLHGVSAEDATNTNIPLLTTRALTTTVVTHNIPVTDGKYTTPGTYEVTYEITDRFGNTQTKTRTVKVHGLVEIEATAQEYLSDDATILSQVESAASASYMKASDGAGSAPVSIDLSSDIKVTVDSGPDGATDFSKVGIYKVTYTVTNIDGKSDSITIDILVLDNGTVTDSTGTLHISAKSFKLANADAKALTDKQAIQLANAQAFKVNKDADGNIIGYEDISANIDVYAHQLSDIQTADGQGGIYDLIFEVTDGNKEVHKRVDVIVLGKNTPEPESKLAITANDFTVTNKEAQVLTKAQALELANAKAVVIDTDPSSVTDLTLSVNEDQLKAINSTNNKGGVYDLEITASYTDEKGELITNRVTIKVTVKPVSSASTAPGTNSNASVGTGDYTNTMYLMLMLLISVGYIVRKKIV